MKASSPKTESPKTDGKPWQDRVGPFAEAVGKSIEEINGALFDLVGEPGDKALVVLSDMSAVSDEELRIALKALKIPSGVINLNLAKLRGPVSVTSADRNLGTAYESILPSVPDDASFIEQLKIGGTPKVDTISVLSAIKAAIANKLRVFEIPDIIKKKMEEFAEEQEEPVSENYFKLQKLVTTRSYAEVLSALGVEGNFMSPAKKNAFLLKLDTYLWDALYGFHTQLHTWQQAWMAGAANPGAMMAMMMAGSFGKNGNLMPPGMMTPPETAGLHDQAESVINSINKVFAGVGIPVARALAYDATRIKAVLEEKDLPATIGATNREQMIKMLGMGISADYVRLERNVTRFTLGIMEFNKITVPNEEYAYLGAMIQLGASIPWDNLSESGIGRKKL